jgi:hypothetical protein
VGGEGSSAAAGALNGDRDGAVDASAGNSGHAVEPPACTVSTPESHPAAATAAMQLAVELSRCARALTRNVSCSTQRTRLDPLARQAGELN